MRRIFLYTGSDLLGQTQHVLPARDRAPLGLFHERIWGTDIVEEAGK